MFRFYTTKFDFWEIYESIKRFYPIGIEDDEWKMHSSYRGLKELEKIIVDNIHDEAHFNERWSEFTKQLSQIIQQPIIGTTYGQAPCFSSYIELEKFEFDNFTRTKEIHFFISLVGPFYTIIGRDINDVMINTMHYRSTNYLVISPEIEYAELFNVLGQQIENRFKGYRFVPFWICDQTIEGLDVRYTGEHLNTIFHALFNDHIDLKIRAIGDTLYKNECWIKEDYVDKGEGWTSYPPMI